jgi:hypothetical protein
MVEAMKGRWWIGVTAGVVLGIGGIAAFEATTGTADAARPVAVTAQQLTINQRISQAAVRRSNTSLKEIATLKSQVPLFAVSSGAVGSDLVRGTGRGALSAQRIDDGNYRVRFDRNISACSWTGTGTADATPVPPILSVRIALDTTDSTRQQLVVRTSAGDGTPANGGFSIQVVC